MPDSSGEDGVGFDICVAVFRVFRDPQYRYYGALTLVGQFGVHLRTLDYLERHRIIGENGMVYVPVGTVRPFRVRRAVKRGPEDDDDNEAKPQLLVTRRHLSGRSFSE